MKADIMKFLQRIGPLIEGPMWCRSRQSSWLPEATLACYTEYGFPDDAVRSVAWTGPASLRDDAIPILDEHIAVEWEPFEGRQMPQAAGISGEVIAWLRRGDRVRLIAFAIPSDIAVLTITEWTD